MNQAGAVDPTTGRRSPSIAAFLSFLWPGLGHWYARRDRAAVLFALPMIGVVAMVAIQLANGTSQVAAWLISPSSALTIAILVVLLGVWREVAVIDSALAIRPRGAWLRPRPLIAISLITAIIVITHVWAGYIAWAFYNAGSRIFVGAEGPDVAVAAAIPSADRDTTPTTAASGIVPTSSRINILLTSVDPADEDNPDLTDTLIVASIDPVDRSVSLISFPREITSFPLAGGGTYRGRINTFLDYVRAHPGEFKERPIVELTHQLSFLLGTPIPYYASVDLHGFRDLVDAAGGVTITTDRPVDDPSYTWEDGKRGFALAAGTHTLDGARALAFVRARAMPGDSDIDRARRQQQVLYSLGTKLASAATLPRIPGLLSLAGETIRTNYPSDGVTDLIDLASQLDSANVHRIVLGEPYAHRQSGSSDLHLDMGAIGALSVRLFGDESRYTRP